VARVDIPCSRAASESRVRVRFYIPAEKRRRFARTADDQAETESNGIPSGLVGSVRGGEDSVVSSDMKDENIGTKSPLKPDFSVTLRELFVHAAKPGWG